MFGEEGGFAFLGGEADAFYAEKVAEVDFL